MKELIKQFLTKTPPFNSSLIKGLEECTNEKSIKIFIAQLTIDLIKKVENGLLDKEEVSRVYLFLDNFIETNFPKITDDRMIFDILFDGQIFYHYNDPISIDHGPNIEMMKKYSKDILSASHPSRVTNDHSS